MSEKKITNREAITFVLENCTLPDDIAEKLEVIKASYERKSGKTSKPTKAQEANIALCNELIAYFKAHASEKFRVTELLKVPEFDEYTSQKMTSLLTALAKDGKIERFVEKGTAYFKVV